MEPAPGRARDFFEAFRRGSNATIPDLQRQIALLDSALAHAQGTDRTFYGFHRGGATVMLGRAHDRAMLQQTTCETARAAATVWRGAGAAFGAAAATQDDVVDIMVNDEIPASLRRAAANEQRLCPADLLAADALANATRVAPGARGSIRRLAGEGRQVRPALHGDRVAWNQQAEHIRNSLEDYYNQHLVLHSLPDGSTRTLVRDTASVRDEIAIGQSAVAWTNFVRRGSMVVVQRDGESRWRQVAPGREQSAPAWSGDRLVFLDQRSASAGQPAVPTVVLYENGLVRALSRPADGAAASPGTSGRHVVWLAGGDGDASRVMVHDLVTGMTRGLPLPPARRRATRMSGDRIIWVETRGQVNVIVLYDLATGAARDVTPPEARPNWAYISGDWVVTVDLRPGGANIYRYDIVAGGEQRLTAQRTSVGDASLWGTRVAWWEGDDIYLYEEAAPLTPALEALRAGIAQLPAERRDPLLPMLFQAAARLAQGDAQHAETTLNAIREALRDSGAR